ncbi:hypothetical protein D3C86_1529280 [compost metagenome]
MYFYGYDWTIYKDLLDALNDADVLSLATNADFLAAVKAMDTGSGKALWTIDKTKVTYDLGDAQVVYTGLNDPGLPTNPSYKYVVGIMMRADVTTPPGVFYLHYNDPVDPDAV